MEAKKTRRRESLFRRCAHSLGRFLHMSKRPQHECDSVEPSSSQTLPDELRRDRQIRTADSLSAIRRTVIVERDPAKSFGFTLQSVVVERKYEDFYERITFVSRVDADSPADLAGIIPGDVIVAIDGDVIVSRPHDELITIIQTKTRMRLIVVFENMVRKVELVALYLETEKLLNLKQQELEAVEEEERQLLKEASARTVTATLVENCEKTNRDDSSSGFEESSFSEVTSSRLSVKSAGSWSFDETSVQYC